jgi:hypothetical protein
VLSCLPCTTDEWAISLHSVLRVMTFMSGAAVVARAWSNYADGQICAQHPEESPRYYGCLSGVAQLVLLSVTRFSAGCVLAALFIVFFTKVSQQCEDKSSLLYYVLHCRTRTRKTVVVLPKDSLAAHCTVAGIECVADTILHITCFCCAQMHNSRRFLQGSFLGSLIDFEPTHELHTEFGFVSLFGAVVHAGGWIANLILAGQGKFTYMSQVQLDLNKCTKHLQGAHLTNVTYYSMFMNYRVLC